MYFYTIDCQLTGFIVNFMLPTSVEPEIWQSGCLDAGNADQEFQIAHQGHDWTYLQWNEFSRMIAFRKEDRARLASWNALTAKK